ncbi:hypothetical protein [Streptomyces sp. CHB9.2]|uniref:hypothetical protein n=1 Tax=Streptomyces sp. CHB9.2 TaxID=2841670 RepID=UPI002095DDB1|nr:hypothetical protein [Streptomyces sp. CHB9.2]MCO6704706.1 hypothetical protein [Streptomyces sp. CHB9.2]
MTSRVSGDLYPRGFIAPSDRMDISRVSGSADVNTLYTALIEGTVDRNGWTFQKRALRVAMGCFSNFALFLNTQKNNPFLYGYNYEFLLDTLKYIQTGRRRVSVQNWLALLTENPKPSNDYRERNASKEIREFYQKVGTAPSKVVSEWISHPEGLNDLVISLYIMFGEWRNPKAKGDDPIDLRALYAKFV